LQELGDDGILVEQVSSAYRTAPRDDTDQPDFMNAAAQVRSDLPPPLLLQHVKQIEARLGRTKTRRFGPRTIDIDILLWSGGEWADPQLRVPHLRLHERRFALVPLVEISPELATPDGSRLQDLLARLDDGPDQSVEVVSGLVLWPVSPSP
jgi:2-amino-4-hydroxy-6-hydroxymethyldihydropteridine diphosphokinase